MAKYIHLLSILLVGLVMMTHLGEAAYRGYEEIAACQALCGRYFRAPNYGRGFGNFIIDWWTRTDPPGGSYHTFKPGGGFIAVPGKK